MENTNCGCDCAFVKSGFCNTDRECPFYCESIWQLKGGTEIKTVKDCYPKRQTMEQNNLTHRFMALQSLQEDLRNRMDRLELLLNTLIQQSQTFLIEKMKEKNNIDISSQISADNVLKQLE